MSRCDWSTLLCAWPPPPFSGHYTFCVVRVRFVLRCTVRTCVSKDLVFLVDKFNFILVAIMLKKARSKFFRHFPSIFLEKVFVAGGRDKGGAIDGEENRGRESFVADVDGTQSSRGQSRYVMFS